LPPYDELDANNLPAKQKIFMMSDMKYKLVKEKLVRILDSMQTNREVTEKSLRLWKCNYQYNNREKIGELLSQHKIGGPNTEFITTPNADPEIVENTGVSFPG
jgi:hypothetical protein